MKSKVINLLVVIAFLSLLIAQCTHEDQEIPERKAVEVNQNELISSQTNVVPVVDGSIDNVWENAEAIEVEAVVPNLENDVFQGYEGDTYVVKLQSLYDADNIYFLIQWHDPTESWNRDTWYFDPDDQLWHQESRAPLFNSSGVKIRDAFYEDKFGVLWNVNNSITNFSCYSTCHTGLSAADGYARHYTNSAGETVDMWHWKLVRTNVNNQLDDQFQDNTQPNGRKSDAKESGGYTDNVQELTIGGTSTVVEVPRYFIPDREYYYYITKAEIDNGTAKEITAVDASGVLTYAGGTINPNTEIRFQREGATTGAFGIPSIYTQAFVGSRGDVEARGTYTGSGWVLEIKRALSTGDELAQDVNFSDLSDQPFGIAVFENAAIAHAIKTGLTLKFE